MPPQEAPNGILEAPVLVCKATHPLCGKRESTSQNLQVMIGQNLTYQVGVLRYPSSVSTVAAAVAVPTVSLAVIAVLVIIGVLVFMRYKQKKR